MNLVLIPGQNWMATWVLGQDVPNLQESESSKKDINSTKIVVFMAVTSLVEKCRSKKLLSCIETQIH